MNHFDDQAPLSKIGITAMFGMLFGIWIGMSGVCLLWHGAVRNIVVFLCGLGMFIGCVRIACSKKAYKDVPGDK